MAGEMVGRIPGWGQVPPLPLTSPHLSALVYVTPPPVLSQCLPSPLCLGASTKRRNLCTVAAVPSWAGLPTKLLPAARSRSSSRDSLHQIARDNSRRAQVPPSSDYASPVENVKWWEWEGEKEWSQAWNKCWKEEPMCRCSCPWQSQVPCTAAPCSTMKEQLHLYLDQLRTPLLAAAAGWSGPILNSMMRLHFPHVEWENKPHFGKKANTVLNSEENSKIFWVLMVLQSPNHNPPLLPQSQTSSSKIDTTD